jgi:hypothetical protein
MPAIDPHALVAQHPHAELAQVREPRLDARVVLVVAGHEERAVRRPQLGERRDHVAESRDRPVDEIAGDRDEVGRELVHAPHDLGEEPPVHRRPGVHVGDLRDREPVERRRQPRQHDRHVHDAWIDRSLEVRTHAPA